MRYEQLELPLDFGDITDPYEGGDEALERFTTYWNEFETVDIEGADEFIADWVAPRGECA